MLVGPKKRRADDRNTHTSSVDDDAAESPAIDGDDDADGDGDVSLVPEDPPISLPSINTDDSLRYAYLSALERGNSFFVFQTGSVAIVLLRGIGKSSPAYVELV